MRRTQTLKMALAAMFLALGILLPFLTANDPALGRVLSLMHIPALLCGFVCGPAWGLAVGAVTPLLRSLLIGAPPMMPTALAMAAELGVYGLMAGLLYRALPKTPAGVVMTQVGAMLAGRLVWGVASFLLFTLFRDAYAQVIPAPFNLRFFLLAAFVTPWPGILLHLIVVPAAVLALQKAKFIPLPD